MGQAPVLKSHKSQLCFTNKFILTFPFIIFSYLLKCIIDNLTADQYIPKNFYPAGLFRDRILQSLLHS